MKKIPFILMLSIFTSTGFAQVQRNQVKKTAIDPTQQPKVKIKELNLSKDQRGKLKEMKQENKAAKDEVENDATLSQRQKKQQLRALKRQHAEKMNTILTDDQRVKLREMRGNRRGKQ
jgi:dTDP-4-dehydrorhamnose 3,5-epimerase-like enzyme